ncbi:hypothetical protein CARUB_v10024408mg [Capsella rubella]|uniref:Uncharacterized protein n=1 Tax=Capsella rubella TaxID=81985 RepID=R0HEZ7_9BRAS|nr:uncharacterized protein LOC17890524 [Capsella rubella]XP_023640641.1 uncharacterized protein LOC17890524 [Capsella rubella]EOA28219.1 hypothetical protein CARUB_v10024408mg [Capsella rubella]
MEESDAVPKPVVVDPPLYDEAPPSTTQRRLVVNAADVAPPGENHLIQRIQRALVELRELRNQFNAILRELEIEVGEEEEQAESSVEDPEDSDS